MLPWTWGTCIFKLVFSFPLEKFSEVELLNYMVVVILIFWEISILFSIVTIPIYILTNSAWGFPFLYVLANICVFFFNFLKYLDIYFYLFTNLAALGLSWSMQDLNCGMWHLVPQPGIELGSPALGEWSLSCWTTWEVPIFLKYFLLYIGV